MDRKKLETILTDFLAGELDWSHVRPAMAVADILAPRVESLIAEETGRLRGCLTSLVGHPLSGMVSLGNGETWRCSYCRGEHDENDEDVDLPIEVPPNKAAEYRHEQDCDVLKARKALKEAK